jgi:hypothetical protein
MKGLILQKTGVLYFRKSLVEICLQYKIKILLLRARVSSELNEKVFYDLYRLFRFLHGQ